MDGEIEWAILYKKRFSYLSIYHIVHTQAFLHYIITYFVKQWYNKSGRCTITSFVMLSLFSQCTVSNLNILLDVILILKGFLRTQTSLSSCFAIL